MSSNFLYSLSIYFFHPKLKYLILYTLELVKALKREFSRFFFLAIQSQKIIKEI